MNTNWPSHLLAATMPSHLLVPAPGSPLSAWEGGVLRHFPDLSSSLAATPQDPIHHGEGDVWTHTLMVVSALLGSPEYAAASVSERGVLFYAALLHDISKPATTRQVGERIVAPGHSAQGAIAARVALWEHGVPFVLREQICRLIEAHQIPFFAFDNRRALSAEYTARLMSADRSVNLLCTLATADIVGRVCPDQNKVLDDISLFRELAQELQCADAPYPFPDAATRIAYFKSNGQRYADEPIFLDSPVEVIMMSGLPASGKNTWVAKHASGLPVVSYDDIRAELGFRHGEGTGTIVHAADDKLREYLRAKNPCVVNATHLSKQMRRRTIDRIHDYGGQVRVVYVEATRDEVLSRNKDRNSTLTNGKLLSMTQRWEIPGHDEVEWVECHISPPARRPKVDP